MYLTAMYNNGDWVKIRGNTILYTAQAYCFTKSYKTLPINNFSYSGTIDITMFNGYTICATYSITPITVENKLSVIFDVLRHISGFNTPMIVFGNVKNHSNTDSYKCTMLAASMTDQVLYIS